MHKGLYAELYLIGRVGSCQLKVTNDIDTCLLRSIYWQKTSAYLTGRLQFYSTRRQFQTISSAEKFSEKLSFL